MNGVLIGRIGEIRRFPVKSMLGLPAAEAVFDDRSLRHDRRWAVRGGAGKLGSGKNARRFQRIPSLPFVTAWCGDGDDAEVHFRLPDGTELRGDDPEIDAKLTAALGEPVTLHQEAEEQHFDDSPVHVVTRREITALEDASGVTIDTLRLRANVVVEPDPQAAAGLPPEREWRGRLLLGDTVVLEILEPMERCVMVNQATADVPADSRVLKAVAAHNGMMLGLCLKVLRPGRVAVGDAVRVVETG
ncbi:MAG TPA: MOSC domain-containing protein [Streptomyces sp.]|nr:MOSC domain-containing protein [Streptomyces sp.]